MERIEQNQTDVKRLRHDMFAQLLDLSDIALEFNMKLTNFNNNLVSQYKEEIPAGDFKELFDTNSAQYLCNYFKTTTEQINKFFQNIGGN